MEYLAIDYNNFNFIFNNNFDSVKKILINHDNPDDIIIIKNTNLKDYYLNIIKIESKIINAHNNAGLTGQLQNKIIKQLHIDLINYCNFIKTKFEKNIIQSTNTIFKESYLIINSIDDLLLNKNDSDTEYIYYLSSKKVININKFIKENINDNKINELLNMNYPFDHEYLCRNIDTKNNFLINLFNKSNDIDKNILFKFYNNPVIFDKLCVDLNVDPNNNYNLIGIFSYYLTQKYIHPIIFKKQIIYYNLALKHGFKFPNFLSFLFAYVYIKDTEIYYNKAKYSQLQNYNKLPKDVTNDHELFEEIYENPLRFYDFKETQKYTNVKIPIIFNKKHYKKQIKKLKKIYFLNHINSKIHSYDYLEELWYDDKYNMKCFVNFACTNDMIHSPNQCSENLNY